MKTQKQLADTIPLGIYIDEIYNNRIPEKPPEGLMDYWNINNIPNGLDVSSQFQMRSVINRHGCWTVIDKIWTAVLAKWIGKRTVLEVMAGHGWIAKALHDHGVDIVTTDNYSWDENGCHLDELGWPCMPFNLDAKEAILEIPAEILLVSWPPYDEAEIVDVCHEWGRKKPIIYIGEWGGCNAVDHFFNQFDRLKNHPKIPLKQWFGIHDEVFIGRWHPYE